MAISRTAEYVALFRALETIERRREPLFRDPFASRFLTGSRAAWWGLLHVPGLRGMIERYSDTRGPGLRTSTIAQTRYIDDFVRKEITRGIRQLVLLGAGFDMRAHRIDELIETGSEVFEVDLPQMQEIKRRRLAGASGLKRNVRYVHADLLSEHLPTKLADKGWEADHRSIFVWEGVTNYLDESSVAAVLDTVGMTKDGGVILFTYVHRGILDGSRAFFGAEHLLTNVNKLGEPWKFGMLPEEMGSYLAQFGLKLEHDVGADDYRRQYLGKADPGYAFYRLAIARVVPQIARS
ncbi:MAG TPA: SAM-dependent methyltransferase [Kofleriaceae bacterium]|nr:SAM-dependent methyltransferase [Kofleriaceae bacterium]